MNENSIIALCSLGISVLTFLFMLWKQRNTVTTDYVSELEAKVADLRKELETAERRIEICEERNKNQQDEIIILYRKLGQASK